MIVGKASAADLVLEPGVTDNGEYGWKWGNNANIDVVTAEFQGTGSDLELAVTGYDVDTRTEVSVSVNGNLLGYLPRGSSNNSLGPEAFFLIPAADQLSGINTVEFAQAGNSGWIWGVTNILITADEPSAADLALVPGVTDNGEYGWRWGSNANIDVVTAEFQGTGSDLELAVTGYDVDTSTEVSVSVNGNLLGYLPKGSSNNSLSSEAFFLIPAADQLSDINTIEFTQTGSSGWIWGVTNILLFQSTVDLTLVPGIEETAQLGWKWGTNSNQDRVIATFQNTGTDATLSVDGYDIDIATEVSVSLNGDFVNFLPRGPNNQLNGGSTFTLPVADQLPGENTLEFKQAGSSGWRWGVTNILLSDSTSPPPPPPTPTTGELAVFHRSGQSFLTWNESASDSGYHVYRHSSPITAGNLNNAERITNRWGALDMNTSANPYGGPNVPANFVINDLATPLGDNTGLFVYTTQQGDSSNAYYAVTAVNANGVEQTLIATNTPVTESVAIPNDVLTVTNGNGKGRIYTQYMDYTNWNPTFNGYAYNYTLALPSNYNPAVSYPLMLELHAYGEQYKYVPESEFDWQVITLLPNDPGPAVGAINSWWYGYSSDHNYNTGGSIPDSGVIANFTEQRVMRSIQAAINHPDYNINENLVHAFGNSMGASGAMSMALRYGTILSGVYAGQPMTNYGTDPVFRSEFERLWGLQSSNLPIVNAGPYSEGISLYGANGVQNIGVWDWMNHHKQVVDRRGDNFAFLMTMHGKQDGTIQWGSQGQPTVPALTDANIGFTARNLQVGHTWVGFAVNIPMFGLGNAEQFPWKYPLNLSFPAVQNATGSSSTNPSNNGEDVYNMNIEWATPHTPFASTIVDQSSRYEISIRSTDSAQSADITPRRTQQFKPNPGNQCSWTATNNNNGANLGSGSSTVDGDSLLTIPQVNIVTGSGTKLAISC